MIQDLYILGATGKVGRTFLKEFLENGGTPIHPSHTRRIVGLASSKNFMFFLKGFPDMMCGISLTVKVILKDMPVLRSLLLMLNSAIVKVAVGSYLLM